MKKTHILFKNIGKWNFEKINNLNVYFAGCKNSVYEFLENNNVKKYAVIDYRIEDQIILNE